MDEHLKNMDLQKVVKGYHHRLKTSEIRGVDRMQKQRTNTQQGRKTMLVPGMDASPY